MEECLQYKDRMMTNIIIFKLHVEHIYPIQTVIKTCNLYTET